MMNTENILKYIGFNQVFFLWIEDEILRNMNNGQCAFYYSVSSSDVNLANTSLLIVFGCAPATYRHYW